VVHTSRVHISRIIIIIIIINFEQAVGAHSGASWTTTADAADRATQILLCAFINKLILCEFKF
jgi:hypothetical protein